MTLTAEQREQTQKLLAKVRDDLATLASGNPAVLFAMRRRVFIRLLYDERGTPAERKRLKKQKRLEQNNLCPRCNEPLRDKDAALDRRAQMGGDTPENTELIHQHCHREDQRLRRFTVKAFTKPASME